MRKIATLACLAVSCVVVSAQENARSRFVEFDDQVEQTRDERLLVGMARGEIHSLMAATQRAKDRMEYLLPDGWTPERLRRLHDRAHRLPRTPDGRLARRSLSGGVTDSPSTISDPDDPSEDEPVIEFPDQTFAGDVSPPPASDDRPGARGSLPGSVNSVGEGRILIKEGKYAEALGLFDELLAAPTLEANPLFVKYMRAICLRYLDRGAEALAAFEQIAEATPSAYDAGYEAAIVDAASTQASLLKSRQALERRARALNLDLSDSASSDESASEEPAESAIDDTPMSPSYDSDSPTPSTL